MNLIDENTTLYTDYPFHSLGDKPYTEAPIRECFLISYDGNKYVQISVNGINEEVKCGYVYATKGRCGEVESIDPKAIHPSLVRG